MSAIPRPFTILAGGTSVAGPSSGGSTDGALAVWNGTSGRILKNSTLIFTEGTTTGQLTFPVGAAATPSMTFVGDTDTGFHRVGADEIGVSLGGIEFFSFQKVGSNAQIKATSGSATAPSYSFNGDQDNGIYRVGANQWGLSQAGVEAILLNGNITLTAGASGSVLLGNGGTSSNVSLGWTGDLNTGFYKEAADRIAISCGGNVQYLDSGGFQARDGLVSAPGYRFAGETSMGMYRIGSAQLGFATSSTLALSIGSAQQVTFAAANIYTPQALSGAGAVNLTTVYTAYTSTGGAEALTLANGTVGQIKIIVHIVDGGSGVLTPTTALGYTTITFTNAGESATLIYTSAGWAILSLRGAVAA